MSESEYLGTIRVAARMMHETQEFDIATGIQFRIPKGISQDEARKLFVAHVTEEVERYFSHECIAYAMRNVTP